MERNHVKQVSIICQSLTIPISVNCQIKNIHRYLSAYRIDPIVLTFDERVWTVQGGVINYHIKLMCQVMKQSCSQTNLKQSRIFQFRFDKSPKMPAHPVRITHVSHTLVESGDTCNCRQTPLQPNLLARRLISVWRHRAAGLYWCYRTGSTVLVQPWRGMWLLASTTRPCSRPSSVVIRISVVGWTARACNSVHWYEQTKDCILLRAPEGTSTRATRSRRFLFNNPHSSSYPVSYTTYHDQFARIAIASGSFDRRVSSFGWSINSTNVRFWIQMMRISFKTRI